MYIYIYIFWCGDINSHPAGPQVVDRGSRPPDMEC